MTPGDSRKGEGRPVSRSDKVCRLRAKGVIFTGALIFLGLGKACALGNPASNDSYSIVVVRTAEAPNIDGNLDDPAWDHAATITNFTQVRPQEGVAPSEKTEVRLLYDSNHLYVGIRAFDSEPGKIVAKQMQREADLRSEDRVRFTIDTFHDLRNGFYFAINPRGSRQDALITPGSGYQREWDGIWEGKATIDEDGWVAEVAIPTKTLSFDPGGEVWGFNVERDIERKGERVRWSSPQRNRHVAHMGSAGVIRGFVDLKQGRGIDFVPYAKADYSDGSLIRDEGFNAKAGFDLFYKVTPALTFALTLNTDFAEAEVDDRRVNLTRFPLFFQEKRSFFLQDGPIFRFAQIGVSALPFHSRRIGLTPNREPLGIIGGGKITGRIGRVNFGVLNVQVDEFEDLESKNLTIARASMNVFGESQTGVIFTHGDPQSNGDNSLFGYDFNFRDSDFRGSGQTLKANFYFMKTDSTGLSGDDIALGASIAYPNDKWTAAVRAQRIEENFKPALGFVSEPGTMEYEARLERAWHPQRLGSLELGATGRLRTLTNGEILDGRLMLPTFSLRTHVSDEFSVRPRFLKEQLFEPFEIVDGITIPRGTYDYNRISVSVESSDVRSLSASLSAEFGGFFDGEMTELTATVGWRPSPHFNFSAQHETNIVNLPHGDFTVNVLRADVNIIFSSSLAWNITNQWDSESNKLGINSRIRWIIKPGSDIYFVINQGLDTTEGKFLKTSRDISTKIAWTFRF